MKQERWLAQATEEGIAVFAKSLATWLLATMTAPDGDPADPPQMLPEHFRWKHEVSYMINDEGDRQLIIEVQPRLHERVGGQKDGERWSNWFTLDLGPVIAKLTPMPESKHVDVEYHTYPKQGGDTSTVVLEGVYDGVPVMIYLFNQPEEIPSVLVEQSGRRRLVKGGNSW